MALTKNKTNMKIDCINNLILLKKYNINKKKYNIII
jgi:hypothetical protein